MAILRPPLTRRRRPSAPPDKWSSPTAPRLRGADRRARRRGGRRRRRRVLELLLVAEQRVQHLDAQLLAAGQREPDAEARTITACGRSRGACAACFFGRLGQRRGRIAQRLDRVLQVVLELLVLEQRLGRRLAVGQARVRAPGRVDTRSGRSRAAWRPRSSAGCTASALLMLAMSTALNGAAMDFLRLDGIGLPRCWGRRCQDTAITAHRTVSG